MLCSVCVFRVVDNVDDPSRVSNPKLHIHFYEGDKSVHRYNQASIDSGKLSIVKELPLEPGSPGRCSPGSEMKLSDYRVGMQVEHPTRGIGLVEAVDDIGRVSNPKVHVHFYEGDKSIHR